MSKKTFRPKQYEDFEIVEDNGEVAGHIRVKPSGVLWAPKGSHSWYKLSLKEFGDFATKHGTKQKK